MAYIESLAPDNIKKIMYEFCEYRVVVYHPDVEEKVRDFLELPDLTFKVLPE